jgi:hypothetical protein
MPLAGKAVTFAKRERERSTRKQAATMSVVTVATDHVGVSASDRSASSIMFRPLRRAELSGDHDVTFLNLLPDAAAVLARPLSLSADPGSGRFGFGFGRRSTLRIVIRERYGKMLA